MSQSRVTGRPQVTLRKNSDQFGAAPVGQEYAVLGKPGAEADDELVALTYRMLKRSMPDENPTCWEIVE